MERFDLNSNTDGTVWITIADAITSLFFVFLIFFIIVIFVKNKPENDFNVYVQRIIERADSLGYKTYGEKIVFGDKGFFQSGKSDLSANAKDTLKHLANSIQSFFVKNDQLVMVVIGHTDSMPITGFLNPKIDDNWDLSVQRAKETREFLVTQCQFPSDRVLPAGFADQLPKASNTSISGRSQNRRIELFLTHLNSIGVKKLKHE